MKALSFFIPAHSPLSAGGDSLSFLHPTNRCQTSYPPQDKSKDIGYYYNEF
jgi:hypothetical protein